MVHHSCDAVPSQVELRIDALLKFYQKRIPRYYRCRFVVQAPASHRIASQPLLSGVKRSRRTWGKQRITPDPDLLCNIIYASPARRKLPSARRENAISF